MRFVIGWLQGSKEYASLSLAIDSKFFGPLQNNRGKPIVAGRKIDHVWLKQVFFSQYSAGFSDPFSAYGNTRAFLDYRIMGFREAVAESARYLTSVEGMDMKDPLRSRLLNHLETYLAQRELAINAAVAASAQMGLPKVSQATPIPVPTIVNVPTAVSTIPVSAPYAPLTPPRASPDNLSPPATFTSIEQPLPKFNVAFPTATPIISFASTANVPTVFRAAPSGFKPIVPQQAAVTVGVVKPAPVTAVTAPAVAATPMNVITTTHNTTEKKLFDTKPTILTVIDPQSPTKTSKAPFRPWANTADES